MGSLSSTPSRRTRVCSELAPRRKTDEARRRDDNLVVFGGSLRLLLLPLVGMEEGRRPEKCEGNSEDVSFHRQTPSLGPPLLFCRRSPLGGVLRNKKPTRSSSRRGAVEGLKEVS